LAVLQWIRGPMSTTLGNRICAVDFCDAAAAGSLAQQDFCLEHFIELCYENLQRIDPRGQKDRGFTLGLPAMRAFVEECSGRALEVAMRSENIGNLQRGRLLDILLWAGELFLLLRVPRHSFADTILPEHNSALTRLAARHS
jgi:hypothetical protein